MKGLQQLGKIKLLKIDNMLFWVNNIQKNYSKFLPFIQIC